MRLIRYSEWSDDIRQVVGALMMFALFALGTVLGNGLARQGPRHPLTCHRCSDICGCHTCEKSIECKLCEVAK